MPAVRDFIRPASVELPPLLQDIMGWDEEFLKRAGVPQYPCLIDQKHITGELYEFMMAQFHEGRAFVMELVIILILIIDLVAIFRGKG